MSENNMVLFKDAALELEASKPTVHRYCRRGLLHKAKLPGFTRARGITRASLNRLLEQISSDTGKAVGHD